jgi:thiamine biosynthesis protein ThiS
MFMEIKINGKKRTFETPLTVIRLLQSLGINPRSVVVERNLKIVPRSEMEEETIQDADCIEIIKLVGGG